MQVQKFRLHKYPLIQVLELLLKQVRIISSNVSIWTSIIVPIQNVWRIDRKMYHFMSLFKKTLFKFFKDRPKMKKKRLNTLSNTLFSNPKVECNLLTQSI